MNVSLPPQLRDWVEREVEQGHYGTVSEYIRHLVRQAAVSSSSEAVESALLKAGKSTPLTPARKSRIRERARMQLAEVRREIGQRRRSA